MPWKQVVEDDVADDMVMHSSVRPLLAGIATPACHNGQYVETRGERPSAVSLHGSGPWLVRGDAVEACDGSGAMLRLRFAPGRMTMNLPPCAKPQGRSCGCKALRKRGMENSNPLAQGDGFASCFRSAYTSAKTRSAAFLSPASAAISNWLRSSTASSSPC